MRQSAGELFNDQDVSHFSVEGPGQVTWGYRARASQGGTAHVPVQAQTGTCFVLYQGEWSTVWDGMALINLGAEPARVELVRRDKHGTELERIVISHDLAPNAKLIKTIAELSSDQSDAQISLESSQEAAILFLRGAQEGSRFLYQTGAIAK